MFLAYLIEESRKLKSQKKTSRLPLKKMCRRSVKRKPSKLHDLIIHKETLKIQRIGTKVFSVIKSHNQ